MKSKSLPEEPSASECSKMNLEELRAVLENREDARPKYMFKPVEEATDTRDYRYVFWLDLMGAKNVMKLSLPRAARSVMKIHAAALFAKSKHNELEINPVMDGVYGFVKERKLMESCLREMLSGLASVFVRELVDSSRFMVRAGVAFGPLIPGSALAEGADILRNNKEYLGGTAIGMGISHAYEAEGYAPPFGVYIHALLSGYWRNAHQFSPMLTGL